MKQYGLLNYLERGIFPLSSFPLNAKIFCSPQNIFIGNKNRKCDFYFYWFILMNGKNEIYIKYADKEWALAAYQ